MDPLQVPYATPGPAREPVRLARRTGGSPGPRPILLSIEANMWTYPKRDQAENMIANRDTAVGKSQIGIS